MSSFILAFHADFFTFFFHAFLPHKETHDKTLRTSVWEATFYVKFTISFGFINRYKCQLNERATPQAKYLQAKLSIQQIPLTQYTAVLCFSVIRPLFVCVQVMLIRRLQVQQESSLSRLSLQFYINIQIQPQLKVKLPFMHFKFTSDNGLETIAKKSTNLSLT